MSNIISFFQKSIKGGVGIRAGGGGVGKFFKINKRGDDYSVLKSTSSSSLCIFVKKICFDFVVFKHVYIVGGFQVLFEPVPYFWPQ